MSFEALIYNKFVTTAFNAGDYTADVSTWTVASGDVVANQWVKLLPKVLLWNIAIAATSTVGAGNFALSILLPNSMTTPFAAGSFALKPGYALNNGVIIQDTIVQVADSTHISIHRAGATYNAGNMSLYFTITMGVD